MNRNFEMFFFFLSVLKCFKIKSVSRLKILFQYIFYKFSILFNTSLTFVNTLFDSPLPGFAQSFFLKSLKTIWLIFAFVWVLTGHFYPHVSSAFAGYSIWFDLECLWKNVNCNKQSCFLTPRRLMKYIYQHVKHLYARK